jgi:hypothetical protein
VHWGLFLSYTTRRRVICVYEENQLEYANSEIPNPLFASSISDFVQPYKAVTLEYDCLKLEIEPPL